NLEQLLGTLSTLQPVSGRIQIVESNTDITVVVDYAHTPDGLRSALLALRVHVIGDSRCVFGFGCSRHRGMRPVIGVVAGWWGSAMPVTSSAPMTTRARKMRMKSSGRWRTV